MKKFAALLLSMLMVVSLCACGDAPASVDNNTNASVDSTSSVEDNTDASVENDTEVSTNIKVGFIFLHDENSTYDKNFLEAAKEACANLGIAEENVLIKTNIPETDACYEAACELADAGCSFVFADSFGHEPYLMEAAKEYSDIQFCHATGTNAHTAGLDNFHNAFASIYEGRYLAGIAAGLKLNEMIAAGDITEEEAVMGYVGAFTYAEVISGYTSFYLGAKSVCPSVTMKVTFTGSWYDEAAEKEAANTLISKGCVLVSQHADSMGAPTACETAKVPNVSYNGSTASVAPETFIVSSRINWVPYFEYAIAATANGSAIDTDWTGTIATGSVELTEFGTAAAEGTVEAVEAAKAELVAGTLHVFNTANFTVDGAAVDSYMADVDSDEAYTPDHEAIKDGYFAESSDRSAPYFDLKIDGIELLDVNFG